MGIIENWLTKRRANKFKKVLESVVQQTTNEAVAFTSAVKSSAWFHRFGEYQVSITWKSFSETQPESYYESFPNILEALLFLNRLEESRFQDGYRALKEDEMTDSEKLDVLWFSRSTNEALGVAIFMPNLQAEWKKQDSDEESAKLAEELRYLREEADEEYFRSVYIDLHKMMTDEPFELNDAQRAAVLSNPRIAHLAPKK
ncbi:hypothetical protein KWH86_16625 [Enterobacter cloacae]|uniref:hypothetical protein n=1 Tax=Enterobacter cloacae TaxID=550 RepID=UPI0021D3885A|nr:hypothetical protein [Enterobacter cloacae]MCU6252001.1 hypothetical protein [Enterobacter cloacae]HED5644879.1 hypothetical protein [Enterobacter cloacae]